MQSKNFPILIFKISSLNQNFFPWKSLYLTSNPLSSPSDFLIKSAKLWIFKWQKNGWILPSKQRVKNRDDFQELIKAMNRIKVIRIETDLILNLNQIELKPFLSFSILQISRCSGRK